MLHTSPILRPTLLLLSLFPTLYTTAFISHIPTHIGTQSFCQEYMHAVKSPRDYSNKMVQSNPDKNRNIELWMLPSCLCVSFFLFKPSETYFIWVRFGWISEVYLCNHICTSYLCFTLSSVLYFDFRLPCFLHSSTRRTLAQKRVDGSCPQSISISPNVPEKLILVVHSSIQGILCHRPKTPL